MLYREIMVVLFSDPYKDTNAECGQNVGFVNVKPGGT
jgi:hypothetical protein